MEPALSSTSFEIPAVFSCRLVEKSTGIPKLVDDKAGSILKTKNEVSLRPTTIDATQKLK